MRLCNAIPIFAATGIAAISAAPPPNDHFAARTVLSGPQVSVTGSNVDATEEVGENLQDGMFGATVWWSWQAPADGWVRIDTTGSAIDTVLQISTGSNLSAQSIVAFNDQRPGSVTEYDSSITFRAAAGTVYNIAVGGWVIFTPETGNVALNITTGAAAVPPYFPSALSFSPASPDVSAADAAVTANFAVQSSTGAGSGNAVLGLGRTVDPLFGRSYTSETGRWNTALPQSGSPSLAFTIRRFHAAGSLPVWLEIIPDGGGDSLVFTGPSGGSGYAFPPGVAVADAVNIVNSGPVDEIPPQLTAISATPVSLDVISSSGAVVISATFFDSPAGVEFARASLIPTTGVRALDVDLVRQSGTAANGIWQGTVAVPQAYPTDNYALFIEAGDFGGNVTSYGLYGEYEMPGAAGNLNIGITGGSAYEEWAYTEWFSPGDALAGLMDDANGDGRSNLLCYAFDLNPKSFPSSSGSLPVVLVTGQGDGRRLQLTYIRRKASANSGMQYTAQFSSDPGVADILWTSIGGGTVTSLNALWEQVVVDDPVTLAASGGRRFARVKVNYAAP